MEGFDELRKHRCKSERPHALSEGDSCGESHDCVFPERAPILEGKSAESGRELWFVSSELTRGS